MAQIWGTRGLRFESHHSDLLGLAHASDPLPHPGLRLVQGPEQGLLPRPNGAQAIAGLEVPAAPELLEVLIDRVLEAHDGRHQHVVGKYEKASSTTPEPVAGIRIVWGPDEVDAPRRPWCAKVEVLQST